MFEMPTFFEKDWERGKVNMRMTEEIMPAFPGNGDGPYGYHMCASVSLKQPVIMDAINSYSGDAKNLL